MRELKVIGLDATGQNVILQDPATDDRFSVPADDRLRAAARGDLSRLGQIEIEMTSQLRPREIQKKIRAGASVEEVAELSGLPTSRVERFAHPVLLERSNAAHLGSKAHPIRPDGPTVLTLGEVVASAFGARGLDPESGEWDAWRPDGGEWVIQLTWLAGRSENSAHWILHRDAHGGTVSPMDDAATELIDPNFTRSLRPIAQLTPGISPVDQVLVAPTTGDFLPAPASEPAQPLTQHEAPTTEAAPAEPTANTAPVSDDEPLPQPDPATRSSKKSRKNKPTMPSWEDVLLGVRSNING
ncbi:septation protein SepH [Tomitella biformata]|uniref:septation protein SepH n=1 Tax=Tomitella biformata TaxID=630403 RepID=UPI000466CB19|nr:septation protein SepH [Tomitella biformata]